jgi:hypothetical protein
MRAAKALMSLFRLRDGLPDFGAAIGTLIDEVDLRHAPMGLDVSHMHGEKAYTAGTEDRGCPDLVVLDVSGHVGSPSSGSTVSFSPKLTYRLGRMPMITFCERTRNNRTILAYVASL